MRVGIHLPQYGRVAGPEAITRAAQHAEALGFDDIWVSDHIVHPAAQSYPSPHLYDPLVTLTWGAAVTPASDSAPACSSPRCTTLSSSRTRWHRSTRSRGDVSSPGSV